MEMRPAVAPQRSSAVTTGSSAGPSFQSISAVRSRRTAAPSSQQSLAASRSQRSSAVQSSQRIGRMDFLSRNSPRSMDANRESVKTHWENMEALRQRREVHSSRSLDHYCHQRVSSQELQERVQDQVLSRFMKRQLSGQDASPTHTESGYLKTVWRLYSNVVNKLRRSTSRSRDSRQPVSSMEAGLEGEKCATEAVRHATTLHNTVPISHDTQSPLQILVVPQLWLWKFDSEYKSHKRRRESRANFV